MEALSSQTQPGICSPLTQLLFFFFKKQKRHIVFAESEDSEFVWETKI